MCVCGGAPSSGGWCGSRTGGERTRLACLQNNSTAARAKTGAKHGGCVRGRKPTRTHQSCGLEGRTTSNEQKPEAFAARRADGRCGPKFLKLKNLKLCCSTLKASADVSERKIKRNLGPLQPFRFGVRCDLAVHHPLGARDRHRCALHAAALRVPRSLFLLPASILPAH